MSANMTEMPNPDSTLEPPDEDYATDGTECLDCGDLAEEGFVRCPDCWFEATAEFAAEMKRDDL